VSMCAAQLLPKTLQQTRTNMHTRENTTSTLRVHVSSAGPTPVTACTLQPAHHCPKRAPHALPCRL